ncbi:MAG: hypothetical protein ABR511_13315 [Acidimicrobiales bacterium]
MARLFLRLKLRLLANGLRGRGWRTVGVVLGAVYGAGLALTGFVILVQAGGQPDADVVAVLLGTTVAVGWVVVPVLGFGNDETLDPTRLALLPLRRRDMMAGLLTASVVGVGGLATLAALSGGIVGFAPGRPAAVLVGVAVVAQALVCVTLGRSVVTALSVALRSRRGRDLRVILVALVAVLPQGLRFVHFDRAGSDLGPYRHVTRVLGWLPTALPMRAMVEASRGRGVAAVGDLVLAGLAIALLLRWWASSLERVVTTPEAAGGRRRAAGEGHHPGPARTRTPLFGAAFAWLPRTRTGVVAARELRTSWREPQRRAQTVSSFALPFVLAAPLLARGVSHRHGLVFAPLLVVALGGTRAYNLLGVDGAAWWAHEATGGDLGADLRGKNLAFAVATLPVVLAAGAVLAALTGGWSELALTAMLALALCLVQLGIGDVLSVRAPFRPPASATNVWASGTGQGCLSGLVGIAGLAAQALLAVPVLLAFRHWPALGARALTALAAVMAAAAVWRLGLRLALRAGATRGPEILAVLTAAP